MEREANYVTVGAFVLLALTMGTLFVIWYTGSQDKRDYTRYEIYFDGSVSGLSKGSPVRYLGVDIGRVSVIGLDKRDANRVQVIVDVDAKAPISDATLASLSLQGVTGLLYIDLERDRGDKPVMPLVPGERYPVIRSVKSNFDLLVSSLPELFSQASAVAERLNRMLSDRNIAAATATMENVTRASAELPDTLRELRTLLADVDRTAAEIKAAASSVRAVSDSATPEIAATLERVRAVAENLATTSARLDAFISENQANVTHFSGQGLLELQQLIRDSRQAAMDFRELTRSIKREPSQLLYEPRSSGVEIAR